MSVADYIAHLNALDPHAGDRLAHHRLLPGQEPQFADVAEPWPPLVQGLLASRGIERLYAHQARACDAIRAGRHVCVATPTASGKSLCYTLPLVESALANPFGGSSALYLSPLKALAQDQLRTFRELTAILPEGVRPRAAVYDGDTPQHARKKLRDDPPHLLLSNPEMVHLSMLPFHSTWAPFLSGLTHVIVDETHAYRGVLGSHMAHVFRRLRRLCAYYGSDPTFVFCSATIGNPDELCQRLTGLPPGGVQVITESGAPRGPRHMVFMDPAASPAGTAIRMLQAALDRGLKTIVYTASRKMTELIALWAQEKSNDYAGRIAAYRAGYLAEERREIEAGLASGELAAVVSTSALELGIDIGELDVCILVGYPGTVMATLQRGGRVGRGGQESAVVLVAGEDALDQYFLNHPEQFFDRPPECAMLNPGNPVIAGRHLACAAAELPIERHEDLLAEPEVAAAAESLLRSGDLLAAADDSVLHPTRKRPQRDVDLRGAGYTITIEDAQGRVIGQMDEHRAFREAHPGAVYLHRGKPFVVTELDLPGRRALVVPKRVGYYTRARSEKETAILAVHGSADVLGTRVHHGRLRVTERITGYEKRRVGDGRMLTVIPLELPEMTFETDGLWFEVPRHVEAATIDARLHFMGGIHAFEHAAIGLAPLFVMADRNDLGGISIPFHPDVGSAAVFIYDGAPGGVGLAALAFARAAELLRTTLAHLQACTCELGCPSCVHSPKCGSGNRPIAKDAAIFVLEGLVAGRGEGRGAAPAPRQGPAAPGPGNSGRVFDPAAQESNPRPGGPERQDEKNKEAFVISSQGQPGRDFRRTEGPEESASRNAGSRGVTPLAGVRGQRPRSAPLPHFCVLDVETRRSAAEVGGWHKARLMGVSVAVLYDSARDEFLSFEQDELCDMLPLLQEADVVIGFNISRFDYAVLGGCVEFDFAGLRTLDLLTHVHRTLGYRLKLDNIAAATLGAPKTADGLQALEWWKQGRLDLITEYCRADVRLTRDVYLHGVEHGHVLFTNKAGHVVRLPTDW